MVRREGWLELHTHGKKAQVYALLEGYVLFLSRDDQPGSPSVALIDLRFVNALKALDVYTPTGPFELGTKDGKTYVLAVTKAEHETVAEAEATRDKWLSLLASAVPDRSAEGSIRSRFRKERLALEMMREHAIQPSAFKVSAKAWKKRVAAHVGAQKSSAPLADRLEKARTQQRVLAAAQAGGDPVDDAAGEGTVGDACGGAPQSSAAPSANTSGGAGACASQTPTAQPLNAPAVAAADEDEDGEGEEDRNAAGSISWWFVQREGSVTGPFTDGEMRHRYNSG